MHQSGMDWAYIIWSLQKINSVAVSVGKCELSACTACTELQKLPQGIQLSKRSQLNGAGGRDSASEAHTLVNLQRENYILTRWT